MSLWHMDWKQLWDGLKQAIDWHGYTREILTDRGSQFYANEGERREKGISQFEAYLAEQEIKHILWRVNHPQTNGQLERFYGVCEQKRHQFRSIDEYVHWHNEVKPHLS
jgi:putative transposase